MDYYHVSLSPKYAEAQNQQFLIELCQQLFVSKLEVTYVHDILGFMNDFDVTIC